MAQRLREVLSELPAFRQAQRLAGLQSRLDAVLPLRFRGEAQVSALEDGELRVVCANGAIASRLRLEAASLADSLQRSGVAVRRISFKVRPPINPRSTAKRPKAGLPAAAKQAFEFAADSIEPGEVRDALERLLGHHAGKTGKR